MLLVTAALTVAPGVAEAAKQRYVALGDSYSSGVGTREYAIDEGCQRSRYAYPVLLRDRRAVDTRLFFRACGGATTSDVLRDQVSYLTRGTDLVTISIGGNDAGFSKVIRQCAKGWPATCWSEIREARQVIKNQLPGRLDRVYDAIRARTRKATFVMVVGYPRIFNEGDECNALGRISPEEQRKLNAVGDLLAAVTRRQADRHRFRFVDPRGMFEGHAVCDEDEWINGVSNPTSESYHPNREGHRAYATLTYATLNPR